MKNILLLILLGFTILSFSCKNEQKPVIENSRDTLSDNELNKSKAESLFDPCSLIRSEKLGELFNVDPKLIEIKNDQYSGDFSKSCNLKWVDNSSGTTYSLLIILMANPIPGETADWASSYLNSRIQSGERSFPDKEEVIKYKKFESIEGESAYHKETGKLFWKINKDYIMAVFLSDSFKNDSQDQVLVKLYNELTKKAIDQLK